MAVTQLNDQAIGSTDFTKLVNATDKNAKGLNQITLFNYNNDSAPSVKVGSVFENNGATFIVDTSNITPTGYSGISNSTTFYLYYDESAATFIYSATVPPWSDSLQGYYNGNDRALFSMYKDAGGTLYQNKYILNNISQNQIGGLQLEGTMKWKYYYYSASITDGDLWDILALWVPTDQDGMAICGQASIGGVAHTFTALYRYSATIMALLGTELDVTPVAGYKTFTTSGTTVYSNVQLMSNFDAI
ncbi:MAG: hypothetical protein OQL19_06840 [Gammaproteobacteria bacterium]|nr:hypothetical protein [Gammaproteobacteria bacterium]